VKDKKTKWIYWIPGDSLLKDRPDDCEMIDTDDGLQSNWGPCNRPPSTWFAFVRRWPVSEAEYRSHHWCKALDASIPEGYYVDGFCMSGDSYPVGSYCFNTITGAAMKVVERPLIGKGPILRKIKQKCEHSEWVSFREGDIITQVVCKECGHIRKVVEYE